MFSFSITLSIPVKHTLNYPLRQPREQGDRSLCPFDVTFQLPFTPLLVEIMGPCKYLLSPLLDPLWSQNHPGRNSSDLTDKEGLISPMISSWESKRLFLWDHLTEAFNNWYPVLLARSLHPTGDVVSWISDVCCLWSYFTSDSLTFSPDLKVSWWLRPLSLTLLPHYDLMWTISMGPRPALAANSNFYGQLNSFSLFTSKLPYNTPFSLWISSKFALTQKWSVRISKSLLRLAIPDPFISQQTDLPST